MQEKTSLNPFPSPSFEEWKDLALKALKGASFEKKLLTKTYEGVTLQPLYTPHNSPAPESGLPGKMPFTRGAKAQTGGNWGICVQHNNPTVTETNKAILSDLEGGASSVILWGDLATQTASGAPEKVAENGVSLFEKGDLESFLHGVYPSLIEIGVQGGGSFLGTAALLVTYWQGQGLGPQQWKGSFLADPLGTLAQFGTLPCSLEAAMTDVGTLSHWTAKNAPGIKTVRISTTPYHNAGATTVDELAFALASGLSALRAMQKAGLTLSEAFSQVEFEFSVGCEQFLEIAKLRAARKTWARIAEACNVTDESAGMTIHALTSKRSLTSVDPWVNFLRTTVSSFSAAAGGSQTITTLPFDSTLGASDDFARRMARNIQILLQEEAHLGAVTDPAGGSWYVETLTTELAQKAWTLFQQIENQGGMEKALTSGWVHEHLKANWEARRRSLAKRKDALTGVNEFPNLHEEPVSRPVPNPSALQDSVRTRLKSQKTTPQIETIQDRSSPNFMPTLIQEIGKGTNLFTLNACLYANETPVQQTPLPQHRFSEDYEALRTASDQHLLKTGKRPTVFMACLGSFAQYSTRLTWATNFFATAGVDIVEKGSFQSYEELVEAFKQSQLSVACVCSTDDIYKEQLSQVAPLLTSAGATSLYLAGNPGDAEDEFRQAGIKEFIFIGSDLISILSALHKNLGVKS